MTDIAFDNTVIQDAARLTELRRMSLLNNSPEHAFDRFVMMLTKLAQVPVAAVSVIGADKHYFKSQVGVGEPYASQGEIPLSHSFCQHVVGSGQMLLVENAPEHPLVCSNMAVHDMNVMAYAGAPLVGSDGFIYGSLCMIDNKPRVWTDEQVGILRELAASVATALELRKTILDLQDSQQREAELQTQVVEMQVAIDEAKKQKSIDEIVNSEFFDGLTKQAQVIKQRNTDRMKRLSQKDINVASAP